MKEFEYAVSSPNKRVSGLGFQPSLKSSLAIQIPAGCRIVLKVAFCPFCNQNSN